VPRPTGRRSTADGQRSEGSGGEDGKGILYLDDYQVGDRMISPARTVTEADIVNFAALTGDWHPSTPMWNTRRRPFKAGSPTACSF